MSAVALKLWSRVIQSLWSLPGLVHEVLSCTIEVSTDCLVVEELVLSSEFLVELKLEDRKAKFDIIFSFANYSKILAV